jgi:preprotein translocase subunit SecF
MTRKRAYRMSGPAVVIGYILLIPSILGILFGGLTFLMAAIGGAATANKTASNAEVQSIRNDLAAQNIPDDIIADVCAEKHVSEPRMSLARLNPNQELAVRAAELKISTAKGAPALAACCGGTFSVIIIIGSFVGGLLGWLLVMRKTVLQCFRCGAVVAAS